ncbi:hypothetical protein N3K66_002125 [Trichothecium roseum]|uniref:Uncharacterized protein n=1 Tax=Trichothecium roseum TaxID=47278 RepID=A0ACC0V9G1_9HYPO|nr:hypothetical protein N3K66_002125 [Trichothecium roseum]
MSSPASPPSPGGTTTTTGSNHANTQSHNSSNNNDDNNQQHYTTYLTSPTHPLTLHNLSPSPSSPDPAIMASLLSSPPDGPLDAAWARGAITRQRAAAAVPTVTVPPSSSSYAAATPAGVISGPKRCDLGIYLLLDDDGSNNSSGTHGRRRETLIGLSGYGSIKQSHPSASAEADRRPRRVGDAGVLLADGHRGKGYAAEAMRLSLDLAAAPASEGGLQLDAVSVTTLEDNVAMRSLAERRLGLGEGVLRPAEFDNNKREVYWEISTAEWRRRTEAQQGPAEVESSRSKQE